jgi:uncharacterized protein (DUF2062 family)
MLYRWFPPGPVTPGTKLWYREKKIELVGLWLMPLMPLAYTLVSQGVSMPWEVLTGMLIPVIGSTAALGFTAYALWRIEINVAGNREHPFTEKDHRVLTWCGTVLSASLFFAVAVNVVATLILHDLPHDVRRPMDTGENTAVILGFVGSTIIYTMRRIHCKAKHAYEELEKGV